jgi:hypothetical protein
VKASIVGRCAASAFEGPPACLPASLARRQYRPARSLGWSPPRRPRGTAGMRTSGAAAGSGSGWLSGPQEMDMHPHRDGAQRLEAETFGPCGHRTYLRQKAILSLETSRVAAFLPSAYVRRPYRLPPLGGRWYRQRAAKPTSRLLLRRGFLGSIICRKSSFRKTVCRGDAPRRRMPGA